MAEKAPKFNISRWKYCWAYLLATGLFIASWYLFSYEAILAYIVIGSGAAIILVAEVLVYENRVVIEADYVEATLGIFSRRVLRVQYDDISDVGVNQTLLQRLLSYGDVLIDTSGTADVEMELFGFRKPNNIVKLVSERMRAHPGSAAKGRQHYAPQPRRQQYQRQQRRQAPPRQRQRRR